MRLIKTLFYLAVGACLVVIGVGNMAPVDVYLLPAQLAGSAFAIPGVPLAAVILASVLIGLLIGYALEWLREGKHRRMSNDRGREVARLREEVKTLKAKFAGPDDDLPKIPL